MIEAVVQTGGVETLYRRAGSGTRVLLLGGAGGPVAAVGLFEWLSVGFRTIAPVLPADVGEILSGTPELWLRGLVDGLGVERPAIVADESWAHVLLRFAIGDPDRVDRMALVGVRGWDGAVHAAPLDSLRNAGHPILLVRIPRAGHGDPATRESDGDPAGRESALAELGAFLNGTTVVGEAERPGELQVASASRTVS